MNNISNNKDKINIKYNLNNLIDFLLQNKNYLRVSFQFNKMCLDDASDIIDYIESNINDDLKRYFFILGESVYGECCVDEITSLHLKPDLIVKVGDSCLTNLKRVKVYYLPVQYNFKEIYSNLFKEILDNTKIDNNNIKSILYYFPSFEDIMLSYIENNKDLFKDKSNNFYIPKPVNYNLITGINKKDFDILNTEFISIDNYINYNSDNKIECNQNNVLNNNDTIILLTKEDNTMIESYTYELIMRYSKNYTIKLIGISKDNNIHNIDIDKQKLNKMYIKKYNLSIRAKESSTFGILIGNVNLDNLNEILFKVKKILSNNNKKYYTFLLGKITQEKLSNFIEYIDCFVLIACNNNSFIERKALDKPIINPIDLLHAFEEKEWDMIYSYNPNYFVSFNNDFINKNNNSNNNDSSNNNNDNNYMNMKDINDKIQSQALALLDKDDENKALSLIFSNKVLDIYDKRNFKGLEINKDKTIINKEIRIGKKGLPIKYEDIDEKQGDLIVKKTTNK